MRQLDCGVTVSLLGTIHRGLDIAAVPLLPAAEVVTAELLEQVCDLDLPVLEAVELPRGYGRDASRPPATASSWRSGNGAGHQHPGGR